MKFWSRSIRWLDGKYLKFFFQNLFDYVKLVRYFSIQLNSSDITDDHIVVWKKSKDDLFSILCDKFGSDKSSTCPSLQHSYPWAPHTYQHIYTRFLGKRRHQVFNVFECGLGTNNPRILSSMGVAGVPGASLRVWREYFPNAQIWGGDIDRDILFQESCIATGFLDQTNPNSIKEFFLETRVEKFDLMVDDGLHTFLAGSTLFSHSVEFMDRDGVYVIEDVRFNDLKQYVNYFSTMEHLCVEFCAMFSKSRQLGDNFAIVVTKR